MSTDQRPVRPITVSIPGQRRSEEDVLSAGPEPAEPGPLAPSRGRRIAVGAAGLLAAGAVVLGAPPWTAHPPTPDTGTGEPVALALVTPGPTATARPRAGEPAFVTLRLRVAVRNDSAAWVWLTGASLGPYRATGDGLGALAPGALASLPLERLVVCDHPALGSAARFLELEVLGAEGPTEVYLALSRPAAIDPATAVPACT